MGWKCTFDVRPSEPFDWALCEAWRRNFEKAERRWLPCGGAFSDAPRRSMAACTARVQRPTAEKCSANSFSWGDEEIESGCHSTQETSGTQMQTYCPAL